MKVLMLSMDPALVDRFSQTAERIKKYASLADKLYIVAYVKQKVYYSLAENCFVYTTGTTCKPLYFIQAYNLAKKIIKNEPIDVITAQEPFISATVGYWLKKRFKVKLNIQLHGDFFSRNFFTLKALYGLFLLRQADSIRVVSLRIKKSLIKLGIKEDKIIIAPVPVANEVLLSNNIFDFHKIFPGCFVLLAIGRLVKDKNFSGLLEIFADLNSNYPNTRLAIIGQGAEEEVLKQKIKQLKLEGKAILYGWQEKLGDYYKTADVLVISSLREGYNRTAVEALQLGLPVVMTNVGLAGEIVINGQNGIIAENLPELKVALTEFITQPEKLQLLKNYALAMAKNLTNEQDLLALIKKSWQIALSQ